MRINFSSKLHHFLSFFSGFAANIATIKEKQKIFVDFANGNLIIKKKVTCDLSRKYTNSQLVYLNLHDLHQI